MTPAKILALSGSTRAGSYNQMALHFAVEGARTAGAEVTVLEPQRLTLPLYGGERLTAAQLPPAVRELRAIAMEHQGLLIAAPEYNGGMAPLLKNTIDWLACGDEGDGASLPVYAGKVAGLVSASPRATAGLRGVAQLSAVLHYCGVLVMPYPVGIAQAEAVFAADGSVKDPQAAVRLREVGQNLVTMLRRLQGGVRES